MKYQGNGFYGNRSPYKHSFDRIYFDNRWKRHKYGRPCDWTVVGISVRWAGPEDYCYSISLFGLSLRIWMKRTFQ